MRSAPVKVSSQVASVDRPARCLVASARPHRPVLAHARAPPKPRHGRFRGRCQMALGTRRFLIVLGIAVFLGGFLLMASDAAETPRKGGVLLAAIGADPPSLDSHQESTFATVQLVAPLYSTLLQFDPMDASKIIG